MPNKNYLKGVRLERAIVNAARKKGMISGRSAGSHSPVDLFIINPKTKRMWFIQCKAGKVSQNASKRIRKALQQWDDEYLCKFGLISNLKEFLESIETQDKGKI